MAAHVDSILGSVILYVRRGWPFTLALVFSLTRRLDKSLALTPKTYKVIVPLKLWHKILDELHQGLMTVELNKSFS